MRILVAALSFAVLAAAPAAGAERITPAGADGAFFDGATTAHVYANGGDTLYRQARGGAPEPVAAGGHFAAEAAGGVVVSTLRPLVPADKGSRGDDLYLMRPDGPVLLTGGAADATGCGQTIDGQPAACLVGFGGLTPDGQGITFTSDAPATPDHSCSDIQSGGCTAYLWRDGAARQINAEMVSPYGTAFNPDRAFATDDGSTVFIGGLNLRSSQVQDRMTYFRGPGGTERFLHRGLLAAAADRRSVLLQGYDDDPSLARWDGASDPVTVSDQGNYVGASADLGLVYWSGDDGLHVDDHGTDRRIGGVPAEPPQADFTGTALAVAVDRTQVAYGTRDAAGAYEVQLASAAGGAPVRVAAGPGLVALTGLAAGAVSFTTTDALTCDDHDRSLDTYVRRADGTVVLASGAATGDAPGQLLPEGDAWYRDDDGLWRVSPAAAACAGTPTPTPSASKLTLKVRVKGASARACGRRRCGRHATLVVTLSRVAKLRADLRGRRLVARRLKAGTTRLRLPYVPRALKAGRRYALSVSATAGGRTVRRTVRVSVR